MDVILESIRTEWTKLLETAPRVLLAVLVLTVFWLSGRLIARGLKTVLSRSDLAETHLGFFRGLVVWVFVLVGLAVSLNLIGLSGAARGLLTGGGITAVVLGFAFREIGENFLAGFFLAFSRPFRVGDLIQSNNLEGLVSDITLRSTHIRTADGRDIYIPSSQIFKNPLINFTRDGLRRREFSLGIAYREDADAVCELLHDKIRTSGLALADPPTLVGITAFEPNFVELTVRVWIDTFQPPPDVPDQRAAIMALCRRALIDAGIELSPDVSQNVELIGGVSATAGTTGPA